MLLYNERRKVSRKNEKTVSSLRYPFSTAVYVAPPRSQETDKRKADGFSQLNAERGWRGGPGKDLHTEAGGLLDHLVTQTGTEERNNGIFPLTGKEDLSDYLVKGIVTPDILCMGKHGPPGVKNGGRVAAAGGAINELALDQQALKVDKPG